VVKVHEAVATTHRRRRRSRRMAGGGQGVQEAEAAWRRGCGNHGAQEAVAAPPRLQRWRSLVFSDLLAMASSSRSDGSQIQVGDGNRGLLALGSGGGKTEMADVGLQWQQALDEYDLGMGLGLRAQIWGTTFF
jgi:hypothetical protein